MSVRARFDELVEDAKARGQLSISVAALDGVRKTWADVARIAGHDRPSDTNIAVQIITGPQVSIVVEKLLVALSGDAAVQEKVAKALAGLEVTGIETAPPPPASGMPGGIPTAPATPTPDPTTSVLLPTSASGHAGDTGHTSDEILKPALGIGLDRWQRALVAAPRGSRVVTLVFRQAGKSTACAVAIAHSMLYRPGCTSLSLSPTQRQSQEIVRKARAMLLAAGSKLSTDNQFSL